MAHDKRHPEKVLIDAGAKLYLVGGAIRDLLLDRPVSDSDFCVVGATPDQMVDAGFHQVGADFPVFLHPVTGQEFALARTERKSARGTPSATVYADPTVSIEEDLSRRDLTINAMAGPVTDECLPLVIDPFGGRADIQAKILRHVDASSFVEDPVRVLRLARFAARFTDFTVAPETIELCQDMVRTGLLDELVGERIWKEMSRGLLEEKPSRMFDVLRQCGALGRLAPELDRLWGVPQAPQHHPEVDTGVHVMMVLDLAARRNASLLVRFAALLHDLGKGVTPEDNYPSHTDHETLGLPLVKSLCERWKAPSDMTKFALLVCEEHQNVHRALVMRPSSAVKLFMRAGAFNRPELLESLVEACECDARGRLGLQDKPYPQAQFLRDALAAARSVDAGQLALACRRPQDIPERILSERTRAVQSVATHDRRAELIKREGRAHN